MRGHTGPSLKERETQRKEEQLRAQKEEERERRMMLRDQRNNEDKSKLGLDLIDRNKLRDHQENRRQK